jgi:hypothetical protein
VSQWRRARPEVVTAGILVASAALAGLAVAGWPGLAIVTIVTAALTLLVLRVLAPRPAPDATRKAAEADSATMRTLSGYSQRRFLVATGISSLSFYEADLRPVLEHLLAARLAERHGVNLYTDPDAARRAFVRTRRDDALWRWIDPAARETPADAPHPNRNPHEGRGIPRQTLARLIDKLEHL